MALAAVSGLAVAYLTLWGTVRPAQQAVEDPTGERARALPSEPEAVAATTASAITAPELPAVARSTPPPLPPPIGQDHPLRDKEFRQDVLRSIRRQKEQIYSGLHTPWLESLGLEAGQRAELVQMLIDYEVEANDFAMPFYEGRPLGDMADLAVVAQRRSDLIAELERKFGADVAGRYRAHFPGPEVER